MTFEESLNNLAAAVLIQACDDFQAACLDLRLYPQDSAKALSATKTKAECKMFFHGKLFAAMCDTDPDELISRLQRQLYDPRMQNERVRTLIEKRRRAFRYWEKINERKKNA